MAKGWQGMNWLRQEKRAALYERDGRCCTACGRGTVDGAILSLDHLIPRSVCSAIADIDPETEIVIDGELTVRANRPNVAHNLVTMCKTCNSSRGARSWQEFYPGGAQDRVRHLIRQPLDLELGKRIVASMNGSEIEAAR